MTRRKYSGVEGIPETKLFADLYFKHKPVPSIGGVPLPQGRQPAWVRSEKDEHPTVRKPSLGHFRNRIKEGEEKRFEQLGLQIGTTLAARIG